ncbi:hypothetical protein AX17_000029 [Amanita inopinata Kibby_2008]|nr:hypothetical protein AX17_000029 [Amanita inopinata Kibby_2008]
MSFGHTAAFELTHHRWKMVKCGPKPRQITARQLRNLVREEKKALARQRSVRQAPPAPASPRLKKRVTTRPSQYTVSLAKKKRIKVNPRQALSRKARTETSVAFSTVTEEIPLFEAVKRADWSTHVLNRSVPVKSPKTPSRDSSRTCGDDDPKTPNAVCINRNNGLNKVSSNGLCFDDLDLQANCLATPRPALHPVPVMARTPSPLDLGQHNRTLDSAPKHLSTLNSVSPQNWLTQLSPDWKVDNFWCTPIQSQLPIDRESESMHRPRVVLPRKPTQGNVSSAVKCVEERSPVAGYHRSLAASRWARPVLRQLDNQGHQNNDNGNVRAVSGTGKQGYVREYIAENHRLERVTSQSTLMSTLPCKLGLPTNEEAGLAQSNLQRSHSHTAKGPIAHAVAPDSFHQHSATNNVSLTRDADVIRVDDCSSDHASKSGQRTVGGCKARYSFGNDISKAAFANAVLVQTGHLEKKRDDATPMSVVRNCGLQDRPIRQPRKTNGMVQNVVPQSSHNILMPDERLQRFQPQPSPSRNNILQSRAPAFDRRSDADGQKARRVITYKGAASNKEGSESVTVTNNATRLSMPQRTVPDAQPVICHTAVTDGAPSISLGDGPWRQRVAVGTARARSTRHWAKRVVMDEFCHRVSTEVTTVTVPPPSCLNASSNVGTWAPAGTAESNVPFVPAMGSADEAAMAASDSKMSMREKITMEFSMKGNVFLALKAVYNRLCAG